MKTPLALTIAGSDSGGGAGIQADLKTFAALGVHGMSAVTAITAQNTLEVTAVQGIEPKMIEAQIEAVVNDIGVDAAKTGMLYSREVVEVVASEVERHGLDTVVDPVIISKSGAQLLRPDAVDTLKHRLLPLAKVVTPNAMEAGALTGVNVSSLTNARKAAKAIHEMGAKAVVVKGGHIEEKPGLAVDVLYWKGEYTLLEGRWHDTEDTHGTGCSFSAAITAELAKGADVGDAVRRAKEYVNYSIKYSLRIGRGHGPLNHMAELRNSAEKYTVLSNLRDAVRIIEAEPAMVNLLAEVQMNIGMALPYASSAADIAAVEGRMTKRGDRILASGSPWFGVSGHISRTILAVRSFDPSKRAAVNLIYKPKIVETCESLGLSVSWYDRREEPENVKHKEGGTTFWGAGQAVKRAGKVPDVIYHLGDWGKEPMIVLVGDTAVQVAERAAVVARKLVSR